MRAAYSGDPFRVAQESAATSSPVKKPDAPGQGRLRSSWAAAAAKRTPLLGQPLRASDRVPPRREPARHRARRAEIGSGGTGGSAKRRFQLDTPDRGRGPDSTWCDVPGRAGGPNRDTERRCAQHHSRYASLAGEAQLQQPVVESTSASTADRLATNASPADDLTCHWPSPAVASQEPVCHRNAGHLRICANQGRFRRLTRRSEPTSSWRAGWTSIRVEVQRRKSRRGGQRRGPGRVPRLPDR